MEEGALEPFQAVVDGRQTVGFEAVGDRHGRLINVASRKSSVVVIVIVVLVVDIQGILQQKVIMLMEITCF